MADLISGRVDGASVARYALTNAMQRLSSTAHNLSNALTPGFKREIPLQTSFALMLDEHTSMQLVQTPQDGRTTDLRLAALSKTGSSTDIVADTNQWFAVSNAAFISREDLRGDTIGRIFTNQLALSVDAQGRIVDQNGRVVEAENGELLASRVADGPLKVNARAEVMQGEVVLGKLRVFGSKEGASGVTGADGYARFDSNEPKELTDAKVTVGFLRGSNVTPAQEMVRINEAMRQFESLIKYVQTSGEMSERAVRKLGDL